MVGYQPTSRGRGQRAAKEGLKKKTLSAFALIIPEVQGGIFTSLQYGVGAAAEAIYHQLIVCNSHDDIYRQADAIMQLIRKHVAGVAIVSPTTMPTPSHQIHLLQESGIPVVLIHRGIKGVRAPLIALPFEQATYKAGRWILGRGHRRVAFFVTEDAPFTDLCVQGLRQALRESGLDLPAQLIHQCCWDGFSLRDIRKNIREAISRMWSLPSDQRPTAIYASYDLLAQEIYITLIEMGLRIPEDISLVSEGGEHPKGAITERLSCVTLCESRSGELAVDLLIQMRKGTRPINSDERFVIPLSISEGDTLGPAS